MDLHLQCKVAKPRGSLQARQITALRYLLPPIRRRLGNPTRSWSLRARFLALISGRLTLHPFSFQMALTGAMRNWLPFFLCIPRCRPPKGCRQSRRWAIKSTTAITAGLGRPCLHKDTHSRAISYAAVISPQIALPWQMKDTDQRDFRNSLVRA